MKYPRSYHPLTKYYFQPTPTQKFTHVFRVVGFFSALDDLPSACKFRLPDPANVMHYEVTVVPDDGFWKGGTFVFNVEVPKDYPYKPPKPVISSKVFGNLFFFVRLEMLAPVYRLASVLIEITRINLVIHCC